MRKTWTYFYVICLAIGLTAGCGPDGFNPSGNVEAEQIFVEADAGNVATVVVVHSSTDVPTSKRYEFTDEVGDDGYYWDKYLPVVDDSLTYDHEALLGPFKQGSEIFIRVIAENEEEGVEIESLVYLFEAGDLGLEMTSELTVYDPDKTQEGYTLAGMASGGKSSTLEVVILNEIGEVIWACTPYGELEGFMSYEGSFKNGLLLFGGSLPQGVRPVAVDLACRIVWEGTFSQPDDMDHGTLHHAMGWKEPTIMGVDGQDGQNTMDWSQPNIITGLALNLDNGVSDVIFEVDASQTNNLVTEEPGDIPVQDVDGFFLDMGPHSDDFFNNAVSYDPVEGDFYYYNHQGDAILQVSEEGDYGWTAGDDGEIELLNDGVWPKKAHGMEYVGDDEILLFDNAGPDHEGNFFTRAVILQFDEDAMTAEIVWEYPPDSPEKDDEMATPCGGDADLLPNGNVLVATGIDADGYPHRIFEVADDEKVWEVILSGENVYGV